MAGVQHRAEGCHAGTGEILPWRFPMKKIRVGLIRCDSHGAYFGALMAEHDPLRLRTPLDDVTKKKYTWQLGAAYFWFYTFYCGPTQMTAPFVGGFEITRVWDEFPDAAACLAAVFDSKPMVCETVEAASDDVDLVFIADCKYIGSDHLELATPGIEKGVPTFIDKPLAYDLEDARGIVDLACQHDVPILSLSILSALPQGARFAARFPEVGQVEFATVKGGGMKMSGHIHAISLAQNFFGAGGIEAVEAMGQNELGFMHLIYKDAPGLPRHGVILNCDVGIDHFSAFHASAFGPLGAIHSGELGGFTFPDGAAAIIKQIRTMVETGKPPVPYDDILENIAVATAGREAQRTGKAVRLADIGFDR